MSFRRVLLCLPEGFWSAQFWDPPEGLFVSLLLIFSFFSSSNSNMTYDEGNENDKKMVAPIFTIPFPDCKSIIVHVHYREFGKYER